MSRSYCALLLVGAAMFSPASGWAQAEKKTDRAAENSKSQPRVDQSIERVAESARKSVVVITHADRSGRHNGVGAGFVVRPDGLIATNLHVVGEGRPIEVRLADATRHAVVEVVAHDRDLDLAIVRIDAKQLISLELGDAEALRIGQAVVAIGNPLGLEHSVVTGVVSARRTIDERDMIQIALPIEPGNSGGPLLDLSGRVVGILTLKSMVTANLGFAIPINALARMLERPTPTPITRWLAMSALDSRDWRAIMGSNWRRRGGRIVVDGWGDGFGGRSICLSSLDVPDRRFELGVSVRLADESGAAGLAFCADGAERHYGFYPSNGQMRLTRFDGPTVETWKILAQVESPHYRRGEFNALKVRLDGDRIHCFVNDSLVVEINDNGLKAGRIGLAKFRNTNAEFKGFRAGPALLPTTAEVTDLDKTIAQAFSHAEIDPRDRDKLAKNARLSVTAMHRQANELERQAAQLRRLAAVVRLQSVRDRLVAELSKADGDVDLLVAGLLVAKLDNDDVDVDGYRRVVDRIADDLRASLAEKSDDDAKLRALNRQLFVEMGFHGSRAEYYTRANSYLNEVLDDREGIPLTLAIVYMEVGKRLGLALEGVGLPGHFVVRHVPKQGEPKLIDVYESGRVLGAEDAARKVLAFEGRGLRASDVAAMTRRATISRMLNNLYQVARGSGDLPAMLRYLDTLVALSPEQPEWRMERAVRRAQAREKKMAIEDADWLLEHQPDGVDVERLLEFRRTLSAPES